ncbi:MAG: sodium:solute symporter [Hydrogenophilales bacterium CG03_land_8_20_14_0_80_62_28]|nr:sodium:solute symporter [Betaproteobacteria bacterium]OIO79322.1 MAG: sodium:solute symporter [Hydrogenophilaceae bacterium CG1_02_62_390]PIV24239.1 MAG: sodium:solute symporter [Hydrogenophilales bacterium CG03_land_8_20_14_0_80_62_28]PIW39043.1 MAG: sodium:solute symporter [Hydrogenophilales bacterium CG15_BIG_FIL_POST_REV_8_21_14_020_62_31]PIW71446.1 MAG: sodium:solute symporter [Hydrogenophilales bacterium CG12_big_fil_rev_8_21_14_0_65_61_21]PIX01817.1 MAG: sodium:solute symporter [Hydr
MLLGFVILYWVVSVAIGLWAATRVHNTRDFAIAGRHLPIYIVTATVFATWFGAETVLGIPAAFLQEGLHGVVADPFGASLCLILVGLFFAAPLYRLNLLTIGDFYRKRFGRAVEIMTTLAIVLSYLGWVGAQITALGLVFNVVSDGQISRLGGMLIGSSSILIYTLFGGMWAVAITDFVQMIVIMLGMLWIGGEVSGLAGGVGVVLQHAAQADKFNLWPALDLKAVIGFTAAWVTMMLGSIPQQDVFQRVQSAKTERIAVWGSVLGGCLYFMFAFVPMFLAYSATLIDPKMVQGLIDQDPQMILPRLVIDHAPLIAQVMFFGALLSAIKSCASATLLAPSVTFTENILKPMLGPLTDHRLLTAMRTVTLTFTVLVTLYAIDSKASIFQMVANAYQITLVMAFVPLAFGVYWQRATKQGALLSIFAGLMTWLGILLAGPDDPFIPAQFAGLLASLTGMILGSLLPQWVAHEIPERDLHAAMHRRSAAQAGHVPHRIY